MINPDNMISVEEDDRITAEEAAKSDSELLWEALRMLTAANDRLALRIEAVEGQLNHERALKQWGRKVAAQQGY